MSKKKKRIPREELQGEFDVLKPIDLSKLGTDDDPCFGKHYDLSQEECRRCGDAELCAIKMNQKNSIKRAKEENKTRYKDLEDGAEIKKYMKKLKKKGLTRFSIVRKTVKKFNIEKDDAKALYKNI